VVVVVLLLQVAVVVLLQVAVFLVAVVWHLQEALQVVAVNCLLEAEVLLRQEVVEVLLHQEVVEVL